jgi:hypothetical protein
MYFVDGKIFLDDSFNFSEGVQKIIHEAETKVFDRPDRIRIVYNLVNLLQCIYELCEVFGKVELIERYDNYMKVRVERQGKTIGSLFGLVE